MLNEEKTIRNQHELFREKSKKRNRPGWYRKINEILYEWHQRCCASNICLKLFKAEKGSSDSQRKTSG